MYGEKMDNISRDRYRFLRFPGGKGKAVTFSYDDGSVYDLKLARIFTEHQMKCTFNLCGQHFRADTRISSDDVSNAILLGGHEIGIHGDMHRAEGLVKPIEAITDILNCRLYLEDRYNTIIRGMAYPDSGVIHFENQVNYDVVKNYLKSLDIAYSRTIGKDNDSFLLPEDWYCWSPSAHHTNPRIMDYIEKFIKLDLSGKDYCLYRLPRLLFIWGHSHEFENMNNWYLIENICEKLAGRDEIWYATNIEIYNYVTAYHSLVFSANCKIVYNPTLMDVWFDLDGNLICVKSGETLNLK